MRRGIEDLAFICLKGTISFLLLSQVFFLFSPRSHISIHLVRLQINQCRCMGLMCCLEKFEIF